MPRLFCVDCGWSLLTFPLSYTGLDTLPEETVHGGAGRGAGSKGGGGGGQAAVDKSEL